MSDVTTQESLLDLVRAALKKHKLVNVDLIISKCEDVVKDIELIF